MTDDEFARFVDIAADEGRFEVALTTYENAAGARVTLISSIHIADRTHYEALQREFERYDAMLYELVGPEDYRPTPGQQRGGGSIPSMIQLGLTRGLGLAFQLEVLDYTPKNFVHADLTPAGFEALMEERGESFLTIVLDMMARSTQAQREIREQQADSGTKPAEFDIVRAFQRNEGRHTLRLMVARMLVDIESLAAGVDEEGKGSVLLEGRNDRALEVLGEQLAAGKKNLAIYYGAAHMPDMALKMKRNMGFRLVEQKWVEAWDVSKRPDKPSAESPDEQSNSKPTSRGSR